MSQSKFANLKPWKQTALRLHYQGMTPAEIFREFNGDISDRTIRDNIQKLVPQFNSATVLADRKPTIFVIGDTQCKQGIDLSYMHWIGAYIAYKQPDIIVHIGDHYDMASLSSYDKGQLSAEGRRVAADIAAGDKGLEIIESYIRGVKGYNPRKVATLGNHEDRIDRYVNDKPELQGYMGTEFLAFSKLGWEVYPFLTPAEICGINFIHYVPNPMNGKPMGGVVLTRLKNVGESFVMGHQQVLDHCLRYLPLSGRAQVGVIVGACLTPDHKVLHADLTYRPLGDIKVGDELVSFEDNVTGRKARRYRKGTVLNTRKDYKECFAVTLASGKVFKVTADHRWVVKTGSTYEWRTTDTLRKGTRIPKVMDEWSQDHTYEAGWLSGMYDGEGCYSVRETSAGYVGQLQMSQKEGLVQQRYETAIKDVFGNVILTSTAVKRNVVQSRVQGGVRTIARVLGTLRPTRLLPKFKVEHLGRMQTKDADVDTVVSIAPIGFQEIVMVEVDEGTMIVEGYAHHNCYDHDEAYKGVTGNHHFRGCVMLYECSQGFGLVKPVSLSHMKELYSKGNK